MPDELVLSLFPGVGLLDRAFTEAGFCVVQGPDLITGGDIRTFRGIMRSVDGVIAGPPCQGFSVANSHRTNPNHPSVINSRAMLQETCRVINECGPRWFLFTFERIQPEPAKTFSTQDLHLFYMHKEPQS